MSEFPDPQAYIILAAESYGSGGQVGAVILPSQNELRGLQGSTMRWTLSYVERHNGICMFSSVDTGGFLGVQRISTDMDGVVRLLKETQKWKLTKTGNGFSVSQVIDDEEMFWHLNNEGAMVRIARASEGIQSWLFKPAQE